MSDLSAPQQAELEKPVTRPVYFLQLEFASATSYLCSANISFSWGGQTWVGLGTLGSVSPIEESEGVESKSMTFSLNVTQNGILGLAVGDVEEYRGRDARLYFCPLNESFQLIDTPRLCWRGTMDTMATEAEKDGTGGVSLKCETSAYGLKRQPGLRLNAAQQKKVYPTDTGFDLLTDLIAKPVVWASAKFQRSIN